MEHHDALCCSQIMLKAGVSEGALRHKMAMEVMSFSLQSKEVVHSLLSYMSGDE